MNAEELRQQIWELRLADEKDNAEKAERLYELQRIALKLLPLNPPINKWQQTIRFEICNMKELHELRKNLREMLGRWDDKLAMVNAYNLRWVEALFKSEKEPLVEIVLKTTVGGFPPELKGKTCHFSISEKTVETLNYVCKDENLS